MIKTIHELQTGKIMMLEMYSSNEAFLLNERTDVGYVDGRYDGHDYYILNGQPTERQTSPVSLSDLTLLDVPAGSVLIINGERYEGVEGDVELEFPLPGTYRLRVECWPYKDWAGEVVVP